MSRNHESGTNKTFVCGRDSDVHVVLPDARRSGSCSSISSSRLASWESANLTNFGYPIFLTG